MDDNLLLLQSGYPSVALGIGGTLQTFKLNVLTGANSNYVLPTGAVGDALEFTNATASDLRKIGTMLLDMSVSQPVKLRRTAAGWVIAPRLTELLALNKAAIGLPLADNTADNTKFVAGVITDTKTGLKPADIASYTTKVYFAHRSGMLAGQPSGESLDVIGMNTYGNSSGGLLNALAFSKKAPGGGLYHFWGAHGSSTWTALKQIAYTDSDITGAAGSAPWGSLTGKPAFVAEGATAAAARAAIQALPPAPSDHRLYVQKNGSWVATANPGLSVTYDAAGRVSQYTEEGIARTLAYNADGSVNTIKWAVGPRLRTETYNYSAGRITGMTATEA